MSVYLAYADIVGNFLSEITNCPACLAMVLVARSTLRSCQPIAAFMPMGWTYHVAKQVCQQKLLQRLP